MRVFHQPDIDYVSIDFSNQVEAKSYFEHGIIVRLDSRGHVIGLDITDSSSFFWGGRRSA
ncbi:MAG: hypothetical protein A2289_00600 [Deltaproteobacteria bacterium RIFOXYA12_FULL_58_15]|nr:MAG: hypothetical protein A2289_00600 [Deltaproteobacteria bacterium RIFOXYA12_FULL_58_15]OGR08544.1 MAG: hypothetical protein A2341_25380 [Deltaproteobacteria bacterium RIFOXYB12_FULL_58_9]